MNRNEMRERRHADWALLNAAAEKDASLGDLYEEHRKITEDSPNGQILAQRLRALKELVAKLDANLV